MNVDSKSQPRHLILILGDQLDAKSAAFDGFDSKRDAVWMAEVTGEATHVWSHKARIAIFLAAMRHFRDELASVASRCTTRSCPIPRLPKNSRDQSPHSIQSK